MTLKQMYDWSVDPAHQWRSWVGHALMVFGIALVFGVNVAVFCYAFREVEQAIIKRAEGKHIDWTDAIADAAVPLSALAVVLVVLWAL